MREILFRGKRLMDGEWVDGSLFIDEKKEKHEILVGYVNYRIGWEVDPETVGQYTGLTDKNGKKIFENDIVRIVGDQTNEYWKCVDYNALIAFIDGGFCALDGTIEDHGFRRYNLARMDFDLEIIGNIHDNPELLEAHN